MTDFNKAVRAWLSECPAIREDRLYYGFLTAGDGNQVFQTVEHTTAREDICGNEIGKYSFAVIDFRALTKLPLSYTAEDLDRAASVEQINAWIKAQRKTRNFPAFDGCVIDGITAPPAPVFAGQEKSEGMSLAKYMIQVVIDYTKFN